MKWLRNNLWLFPLALVNVAIRAYGIGDPWLRGHRGFSGALSGLVARNYLRFGYLETRLAPVWLVGPATPHDLATHYHLRHPSLRYLVESVLFRALGVSEWVTTLMPVLFSLGSAVVLYFLIKRIWGKWTAILAVAFLDLVPLDAYYGNMASHESMAIFFALLSLLIYHTWLEKPTRRLLIGLLATLALGAFAGWAGFFIIGLIGLHYLVMQPREWRTLRFALGLWGFALLLFAAWVAYAGLLLGSVETFSVGWLLRTGAGGDARFTLGAYYALEYMRVRDFFTPTLRLLALAWGAFFIWDWRRNKHAVGHSFVLLLLLYGLAQPAIFKQGTWVHEYWLIFLTPFFAVAAAVAVARIGRALLGGRKLLIAGLVVVVWAFYLPAAIGQMQAFYQVRDGAETRLARELNARTTLNEWILLGFDVAQPYFDYYADRRLEQVSDLEDFQRLQASGKYRFCVLKAPRTVDERLVQTLVRDYPAEAFEDYLIFDLKNPGERLVRVGAQPAHPVNRAAAPGVELMGYDGSAEVRLTEPDGQSLLNDYLHSSSYQPEPTWRQVDMTLFWRAGPGIQGDNALHVRWAGTDGKKTYYIEPKYAPVLATYSTGLWQPGEVIAATYSFEVGEDDPAGVYRLELAGNTDADTLVLGQIAVTRGPAQPGSIERPSVLHEVTIAAGSGVDALGYATDRETYTAGNTLELRTFWQSTRAGEGRSASACLQYGTYEVCRSLGVIGGADWATGRYFERGVQLPLHPAMLGGQYDLTLQIDGDPPQTVPLGQVGVREQRRAWLLYSDGQPDYEGDRLLKPADGLQIKYTLDRPTAVRLVVDWTGRAELTQTRVEAYLSNASDEGNPEQFLGVREIRSGGPGQSEWAIPAKLASTGTNVVKLRVANDAGGVHRLGWRGWVDRLLPDLLDEPIGPRSGTIQVDALRVERDWMEGWPAYLDTIRLYGKQKMWAEAAGLYAEAAKKGIVPQSVEDVAAIEGVAQAGGQAQMAAQAQQDLERLITNRVAVGFGGQVRLEGYDFGRDGRNVSARLYFRCLAKSDADWTVWLHASPGDPGLPAPAQGTAGFVAIDQQLPTRTWIPGRLYAVQVGARMPSGAYDVKLGLWRPEDGARLFRDDRPGEHELDLGRMDLK